MSRMKTKSTSDVMAIEFIEYEVCDNCFIAAANDDYSGMTDEEERDVRARLLNLGDVIPDGEDLGFLWQRFECCDALPGDRKKLLPLA